MATITINTRSNGPINFWCPDDGGYVRCDLNGQSGALGAQLCDSGALNHGSTVWVSTADALPAVARRWLRQRRSAIARRGGW